MKVTGVSLVFCILPLLAVGSAQAASLAFTDFNDSTASGNTKSNLNWTLNGLDDPGNMSAFNAGGSPQAIFDGTAYTQDSFLPGLNTGNGNTFWTTEVSLTVTSDFNVTLEDVTFTYVPSSLGEAFNANRDADFRLTLFNPSNVVVEQIDQLVAGVGNVSLLPDVTIDFADVVLSDPGTYTLRIQGGDIINDETGNHTGLDNLSINGTAEAAQVIPEPSAALLGILGMLGLLCRRR